MDKLFEVREVFKEAPVHDNSELHCHTYYEIYHQTEGNAKYIIEGKEYNLHPNEILLIKNREMHRIEYGEAARHRHISIKISPEFFEKNRCEECENMFLDLEGGSRINASTVLSAGMKDAILHLQKYMGDTARNIAIAQAFLVELLYQIHSTGTLTEPNRQDVVTQNIADYINQHYAEDITLDMLANVFFMSKISLWRIFQKQTGLTTHEYLIRKRFIMAKKYEKEGQNLKNIATLVGFKAYSSFYRAYLQFYGKAPSEK